MLLTIWSFHSVKKKSKIRKGNSEFILRHNDAWSNFCDLVLIYSNTVLTNPIKEDAMQNPFESNIYVPSFSAGLQLNPE